MLDLRQEAAREVVKNLVPFEEAVDIAIAQAGRFLATLAEGRLEAQLAPAIGHKAMMTTMAAVAGLAQAREGMVGCRRELAATRARLGMQETALGSLMGCPTEEARLAADQPA